MNYQEMLDDLSKMDDSQRTTVICEHWQTILSDGFVAFVQGQIDGARNLMSPTGAFDKVFEGQNEDFKDLMRQEMHKTIARYTTVWNTMTLVYQKLQQHSEQHSASGGMVDHGRHREMPRGVNVAPASHCYRCGSPAAAGGLCKGCADTRRDWDQADAEYDRELVRRQADDLDYQRIQDDNQFYDTQPDFNSYDDYS